MKYKDSLDEGENDDEELKEGKENNMKESLSNYFLAKNTKSGLYQGLEAISNLLFLVEQILTIAEKLKNLIFWRSRTATLFALFLLIVSYLGLAFLPLRYILIVFYVFKFKKGYTFYERVYKNNIECGRIEICRFLDDKNFDF